MDSNCWYLYFIFTLRQDCVQYYTHIHIYNIHATHCQSLSNSRISFFLYLNFCYLNTQKVQVCNQFFTTTSPYPLYVHLFQKQQIKNNSWFHSHTCCSGTETCILPCSLIPKPSLAPLKTWGQWRPGNVASCQACSHQPRPLPHMLLGKI